jgi:hypothetical protein
LIISLPETPSRRQAILENPIPGMVIFDGVKQSPGWLGCANSYKALAQALISLGAQRGIICEDDVTAPLGYELEISRVMRYLDTLNGDWDLFAGLISDFSPQTIIHSVDEFEGHRFVRIDRFTSTVFNVYNLRALQKLATWNFNPEDGIRNSTIDRKLSNQPNLKVICLESDIFGHDSRLNSTLWGVKNTRYTDTIAKSQETKSKLISDFLNK